MTTLARVYNKFLIDLLMDTKRINGDETRAIMRKSGHKAVDTDSIAYMHHAASTINRSSIIGAISGDLLANNEIGKVFEPIPGVSMEHFTRIIENASEKDRHMVHIYFQVMITLCVTHVECGELQQPAEPLVITVLDAIAKMQSGDHDGAYTVIKGIMEEDIVMLLERLDALLLDDGGGGGGDGGGDGDPMENILKNSKIADLAKEVAGDIDIAKLMQSITMNSESDPKSNESFDFSKLAQNSSFIGDIVSSVGSKIQSKLSSGELNHQDLMKEAMGLMSSFNGAGAGGSPLMSDVLSAMSGFGGKAPKSNTTRDKLIKRLQDRKI